MFGLLPPPHWAWLYIDDASDIKEIYGNIKEKGIAAKHNTELYTRCAFISSINKELLTKLVASSDRYIPIHCVEKV